MTTNLTPEQEALIREIQSTHDCYNYRARDGLEAALLKGIEIGRASTMSIYAEHAVEQGHAEERASAGNWQQYAHKGENAQQVIERLNKRHKDDRAFIDRWDDRIGALVATILNDSSGYAEWHSVDVFDAAQAQLAEERAKQSNAEPDLSDLNARLDPVYQALKDGDCTGAALAMERVLSWCQSAAAARQGSQR